MSNIYLEVTNGRFSKLRFSGFKKFVTNLFWAAPTHADVIEFQNFLLQLKNETSESKAVCGFSIILVLKGIMAF